MEKEKMVKISVKDLKKLLMAIYKLEALKFGGVDNWEFYEESLDYYGNVEELVESDISNIKDEIFEL